MDIIKDVWGQVSLGDSPQGQVGVCDDQRGRLGIDDDPGGQASVDEDPDPDSVTTVVVVPNWKGWQPDEMKERCPAPECEYSLACCQKRNASVHLQTALPADTLRGTSQIVLQFEQQPEMHFSCLCRLFSNRPRCEGE